MSQPKLKIVNSPAQDEAEAQMKQHIANAKSVLKTWSKKELINRCINLSVEYTRAIQELEAIKSKSKPENGSEGGEE